MSRAKKRHEQKIIDLLEIRKKCKQELGKLSKRDLWLLGLGIYLGEGSKSCEIIRVINANPKVIKLAVKWFKKICGLRNENFSLRIHIYPDNDINDCIKFWSKTSGIPSKQFKKTQIDKRIDKSIKKKNKLPYGTAHLIVKSNGNKDLGVKLHRKIIGWIECVLEQI